jgi:MFS family permease
MRNFEQNANSLDKLLMLVGSVVGGAVSVMLIKNAPLEQATIACGLVTAGLAIACSQLTKPMLWWTAVGAIAGITIGTSAVLSESLAQTHTLLEFRVRLTIVGSEGLAGFIAGMLLGRRIHNPHVPSLKTFLSTLGALTAGIFAVNVTAKFIFAGLEEARSYSSRLSTSTTIFITALVVPGLIGYLLTERRTNVKRSETSERR